MDSKRRNSMSVALVALLAAWTALSHAPAALAATDPITITLYLHNNVLSLLPSGADVLIPPNLLPLNSLYGGFVAFDDSVTAAASSDSLEIARARGSFLAVAKDTLGAGFQFTFTAQFNPASGSDGSTLNFMGFDRTTDTTRYLSIIGGTGVFVKASGQAVVTTSGTTSSVFGSTETLSIAATFTYGF